MPGGWETVKTVGKEPLRDFKQIGGNITSPDVANQSCRMNGLNEVTIGDDIWKWGGQ